MGAVVDRDGIYLTIWPDIVETSSMKMRHCVCFFLSSFEFNCLVLI